jgi:prevent-host-death family protein
MPKILSTPDAKSNLSALLNEVARGGEITFAKRGMPVAKLVPATPSFNREKARLTAEGLRAASRGLTLRGIAIRNLVNNGRR